MLVLVHFNSSHTETLLRSQCDRLIPDAHRAWTRPRHATHRVLLRVRDGRSRQCEVARLPALEELPPALLLLQVSLYRRPAVRQQTGGALWVAAEEADPLAGGRTGRQAAAAPAAFAAHREDVEVPDGLKLQQQHVHVLVEA